MTTASPDLIADVEALAASDLVEAILDLENETDDQLADPDLAEELAAHVKDHVDALVALRGGDGEQASSERRRRRRRRRETEVPEGPVPDLSAAPPIEQARWIFLERYISLEKHEDILGAAFQPEEFAQHQEGFERLVKDLLLLPRALMALEDNDVTALQRLFASCVPVFRFPQLAGAGGDGEPVPTSVESLRDHFPSFFYKRRKKPNWFERQDFYREPLPGPRWVLCETEYSNCTLRRPEKRLESYARDWDLPPEYAEQKSIVEDIYDRIVIGEALGEDLFAARCNSLTSTRYRARRSRRLVYAVQKVHKITIHGKSGVPHWRAKRRLWPGAYPCLAFPDAE